MIRLERNIISSWIDRNPMLHLKRTGAYLKYVATFWDTVFDTPLRDIDQFRLYLADKNRCNLTKREQAYAEQCREITYTVYAALVSEALDSEAPMNYEEIERRAEKLLQTTPPFPIIIDLRTNPVSPAVGPCERLCAAFRCWVEVDTTCGKIKIFGPGFLGAIEGVKKSRRKERRPLRTRSIPQMPPVGTFSRGRNRAFSDVPFAISGSE